MQTIEDHLKFLQDPEGYYQDNPGLFQFSSIQKGVQSPFTIVDRQTILKDLVDFLEKEVPNYLNGNAQAKADFAADLDDQIAKLNRKIDEVFDRTSNGALQDTQHKDGNNGWFWNKHYEGANTLQGIFVSTARTISKVLVSKHLEPEKQKDSPDTPSKM